MKDQTNAHIQHGRLQRRLRNHPTDAEQLLWRHLRGRQMLGCKFRRQHPFGDYILDLVCLERKLAVELDGGQHAQEQGRDAARDRFLTDAGFRVLRFWNKQVTQETQAVLEAILMTLNGGPHPPSSSPLEGGRTLPPPLEPASPGYPPLQGEGRGEDEVNNPPEA